MSWVASEIVNVTGCLKLPALFAIAYKSRIDVLVPLGVRVELDGFGVSKGWSAEEDLESRLPADAPVVHVRGIGYKGTIEVSTKPRDSGSPGSAGGRQRR